MQNRYKFAGHKYKYFTSLLLITWINTSQYLNSHKNKIVHPSGKEIFEQATSYLKKEIGIHP